MTIKQTAVQKLTRPNSIWTSFTLILACIMLGLISLSGHALRLSHASAESQQREKMQQEIALALWRLDSGLPNYIATLIDPPKSQPNENSYRLLIKKRFSIRELKDATKAESKPVFVLPRKEDSEEKLETTLVALDHVSASAVINVVDQVLADGSQNIEQEVAQSTYTNEVNVYATNLQQSVDPDLDFESQLPTSDLELLNRNMLVQQQVAFNFQEQMAPEQTGIERAEADSGQSPESRWSRSGKRLMTVWVDDQLFIVRPKQGNTDVLDGAWVDWQELKSSMAENIADLLPDADFLPVTGDDNLDPSVTLASLPARLVRPTVRPLTSVWSPTHNALLIAWITLIAAAAIAAIFLKKMIALSERRATFVSAVTHELRTPLTTFRLYTDLLARDMVTDPKNRKEYLQTLRQESDRLTHLIDNVLRYSKLERSSAVPATEIITLADWIDRIAPRLSDRLRQCDLTLDISSRSSGQWKTDPPAMEQVLFNLIDNAAKYAKPTSDPRVHLTAAITDGNVVITVSDHGPGVPETMRAKIFQPFSKSAEQAAETAAGVGLGLALARQTAHAHGGTISYESTSNGGATFILRTPTGLSTT